jgi:hypothetical protein
VSENKMPRKIFGPKKDELSDRFRIRTEDLCALNGSTSIVRTMKSKVTVCVRCTLDGCSSNPSLLITVTDTTDGMIKGYMFG